MAYKLYSRLAAWAGYRYDIELCQKLQKTASWVVTYTYGAFTHMLHYDGQYIYGAGFGPLCF